MKHCVIIVWLLSWISLIRCNNILDISDYTFYYTTYHYLLPSLTTETTSFYNDELSTNITISFNENISIILNNHTTLNLLNDKQWNEISIISRANSINSANKNNKRRRLGGQTEYSDEKQYEGVPHGRNWKNAQKYCKSTRRGHLATVMDEDENTEVATECSRLGRRWHCWLGTKRPFEEWINGEEVEYTNWLPNEPNNWKGNENCAEIYGTNEQEGFEEMWNDLKCDMMRGIVCERPERQKPPRKPRKLICDCEDINLNRDNYLRRRLKDKCDCSKKKLTRKEIDKRKKSRLKWARIRAHARWKRRKRQRKRRAFRKAKRRSKRRRRRWRKHMRYLRRKNRAGLKREYKNEMRLEKRRNAGYALLNKLIGSALGNKHSKNAQFGEIKRRRRRRRMVDVSDYAKHEYDGYQYGEYGQYERDMISRCKIIENGDSNSVEGGRNYEICVNYNFGDMFLSVDIRFVDRKVMRDDRDSEHIDFRGNFNGVFDDYHIVQRRNDRNKYKMFDSVEGNLGYAVWKYELMDWHSFDHDGSGTSDIMSEKYKYGTYKKFDDYVHYFDEYELYFNNNKLPAADVMDNYKVNDMDYVEYINEAYIECSDRIGNLPFKMCMKQVKDSKNEKDTILYFEKDVRDKYVMNDKYSFQKFENNVFYFNNDQHWDEISVINIDHDLKWIKKCSFKLLIAKICIEQFHINDSRGSIKFQSKNKYNASV